MGIQIDLSGKVAVVTGGNSGIGAAVSRQLAAAGAAVMVSYVANEAEASQLVDELSRSGADAASVRGDISQPAEVAAMFGQVDDRWGHVDILVNNAGVEGHRCEAWAGEVDDWRHVIDVNLYGTYLMSRAALARMVPARRGAIITVTSVHELIPWSGYSAYAASKAGAAMLMKTLAQEAAGYGVRAVCVAPGAIKTEINEPVWSRRAGLRDLLSKIPEQRLGGTDEVAATVAFLASDLASYITGSTVFVDGGMMLYPDFRHGG